MEEESTKLSKKKLRKKQRPTVAQLKQVCAEFICTYVCVEYTILYWHTYCKLANLVVLC